MENVVSDHLSKLIIAHNTHNPLIFDEFPEESLLTVSIAPWYAHIANFFVTGELPMEWTTQEKRFFHARVHLYYWEEPFLFKYCAD